MVKRASVPFLTLLMGLFSSSASAEFGIPYVTPEHPAAGETIYMNIYQGGCDGILGIPGYPQITQEGDAIRAVFNGVRYTDPELCTLTYGTATYAVGSYPSGLYTLQVDLRYPNAGGEFVIETLGVVSFTVEGVAPPPAPLATPALSPMMVAFLALLVLGVVCVRLSHHRRVSMVILLACVPLSVRGQDAPSDLIVELLLTDAPGAPTPQQIVEYYQQPGAVPPLTSLSLLPPRSVEYLLPDRAQGEFLAQLQEHPNASRAKLERCRLPESL